MSCWWGIWGNNWSAVPRMFASSKLEFIELFSRAGVLFVHQNHVNRLAKDKIVDADGSLLLYEALGGKARGFSKLRLTKYGEPWPLRCYLAAGMVRKRCFVSKRLIEWWFPVIQDGLMNFLLFPSCKNLGFRKPLALASLFTGVLIRLGWGSIPFHDFHSSPHCKKFQRSSCQELGHTIWSSAYKTQGLFNWLLGKRGAKPGGTQTLRWRNASTPLYNAINSKPFYTGCVCEKFETMRKAREHETELGREFVPGALASQTPKRISPPAPPATLAPAPLGPIPLAPLAAPPRAAPSDADRALQIAPELPQKLLKLLESSEATRMRRMRLPGHSE